MKHRFRMIYVCTTILITHAVPLSFSESYFFDRKSWVFRAACFCATTLCAAVEENGNRTETFPSILDTSLVGDVSLHQNWLLGLFLSTLCKNDDDCFPCERWTILWLMEILSMIVVYQYSVVGVPMGVRCWSAVLLRGLWCCQVLYCHKCFASTLLWHHLVFESMCWSLKLITSNINLV